jgi:hypothetical protein
MPRAVIVAAGDLDSLPAEVSTVANTLSSAGWTVRLCVGGDATRAGLLKRKPDQAVDLADVEKFGQVLDVVCRACIVEPAELDVTELGSFDKQTIFNWANQAAGKLEPFRHQPNGSVESAFTVGDLPSATK